MSRIATRLGGHFLGQWHPADDDDGDRAHLTGIPTAPSASGKLGWNRDFTSLCDSWTGMFLRFSVNLKKPKNVIILGLMLRRRPDAQMTTSRSGLPDRRVKTLSIYNLSLRPWRIEICKLYCPFNLQRNCVHRQYKVKGSNLTSSHPDPGK